ncbi:MAG: hypothetical protein GY703_11565 [Gammaproteobacteria bacterium]|nr:hypothetical protein [Gammaproteobacteria bacterium]
MPTSARSAAEPERIQGQITTPSGFSWKYAYDIRLTEKRVVISVAINPVPAGVSKVELDRVVPIWKVGIERYWSRRYQLVPTAETRLPIEVEANFRAPVYHHDVIVRPGKGHSDELNWHLQNSPELAAHEFGHMLGLFDEYEGGAQDPVQPVLDKTSIMTRSPTGGATQPRHYRRILGWFEEKAGLSEVKIEPMKPE